MSVVHEYEGEHWVVAKGSAGGFKDIATTKIVDNMLVPLTAEDWDQISSMNDDMGSQAMRVIALLARRVNENEDVEDIKAMDCLLYTSPSPRDQRGSRMPSSA